MDNTPKTCQKCLAFDHIPRIRLRSGGPYCHHQHMRQHKHLDDLMNRAEMDGRCCSASSPAERQAMLRRTRCGDVVRPFRSVYARREYWDGLNPIEQASHVIREMARRHPERVFAGLSAAVIYGFEHSWTLHDEP